MALIGVCVCPRPAKDKNTKAKKTRFSISRAYIGGVVKREAPCLPLPPSPLPFSPPPPSPPPAPTPHPEYRGPHLQCHAVNLAVGCFKVTDVFSPPPTTPP